MIAPASRSLIRALVFGLCVLATLAKSKDCVISLKKELKPGHPVFLQPNATAYLYPVSEKLRIPVGEVGLSVACPSGNLLVKSKPTNRSRAALECGSKGKFRFAGDDDATSLVFQVKDLKCNGSSEPVARLSVASGVQAGLDRAQLGLELRPEGNATEPEFLAAIEVLAGVTHGQRVRWARTRVPPTIAAREKSTATPSYKKGVLDGELPLEDVYVRANQRKSFVEIFNNTALADAYLPASLLLRKFIGLLFLGDKFFVQGPLITGNNLLYESQQNASYIYDNVVPIWEAVGVNGNWKFVDDLIRIIASQSQSGLDIWSGSHQQLYLEDPVKGDIKFISLTHGVIPPQFLYKYVYDPATNKGLAFLTLNNPYLERISSRDIICDKYSPCDIQYPEFLNRTRGYTYCCRLEDFRFQASLFGLPTFKEAIPLL